MGQISREQREQAKQSVGSLSSLLLSNYVSSTAPFHLCSQLLSNTWPPYAFFVTPQKNRWRPETSAKKNMYTDISDVQVQGLNSSPTTIIANYLWSSYFHMCVLFPCFVPHSCLLTFCCFICLFLQPKTFQLHCHWRCQYFSNTSKGRVCGAADNAVPPSTSKLFQSPRATPQLTGLAPSLSCRRLLFCSSCCLVSFLVDFCLQLPQAIYLDCIIALQHCHASWKAELWMSTTYFKDTHHLLATFVQCTCIIDLVLSHWKLLIWG